MEIDYYRNSFIHSFIRNERARSLICINASMAASKCLNVFSSPLIHSNWNSSSQKIFAFTATTTITNSSEGEKKSKKENNIGKFQSRLIDFRNDNIYVHLDDARWSSFRIVHTHTHINIDE